MKKTYLTREHSMLRLFRTVALLGLGLLRRSMVGADKSPLPSTYIYLCPSLCAKTGSTANAVISTASALIVRAHCSRAARPWRGSTPTCPACDSLS